MLVVGSISADDVAGYAKCGICGCGVGSPIVKKPLIEAGKFDEITALAEKYVLSVKSI